MAAEPILAANLWTPTITTAYKNDGNHTQDEDTNNNKSTQEQEQKQKQEQEHIINPRKLSTHIKAIDAALNGGLEYGAIHCVVPDTDQDARDLMQTLLISHFRGCSSSSSASSSSLLPSAAVVESSSAFDVRRFYKALEREVGGAAMQMLERVKIMKVFDEVGLMEAVEEVRGELEKRAGEGEEGEEGGGGGGGGSVQRGKSTEEKNKEKEKVPKSTIEDSEGESGDEEMLEVREEEQQQVVAVADVPAVMRKKDKGRPQHPSTLLIIDNISQLFSPLIKNNYTSGQALLATFMRSLGHVTKTHRLCTVLVSNASNRPASEGEMLSLFGSCTLHPALGVGFGSLVDILIYLHSIPTKNATTEAEKHSKGRAMVSVLEVVQDRRGGCFGRWAPFLCNAEGDLKDI